ncbi:MAG: hypothetical protein ACLFUW_00315 [Bacteroidales bacterium]
MQQLDLFQTNSESYLFNEVEKIRKSLDKRSRAMFALIGEMQEQLILLQDQSKMAAVKDADDKE